MTKPPAQSAGPAKVPDGHFPFAEPFGDARVAELRLLSWVDLHGETKLPPVASGPWHDLLVALVSTDLLTTFSFERGRQYFVDRGQGSSPAMASQSGAAGDSFLDRYGVISRTSAVEQLYLGAGGSFRITHRGRVRLSELKQALRSGREREPFGILWDVRHWQQDLQIALIEAAPATPVSVAYMDMNGLKALNDQHGHDAGDHGLRMYFKAVASVLAEDQQAYRLGGDEVLAVLPRCEPRKAAKSLEVACRRLCRDSLADSKGMLLSVSIGIVSEVDPLTAPEAVRSVADRTQYRAKEASKKESPRPSVIAFADTEELKVIRP